MPLPIPNLDDRDFNELVRQARDLIDKDLNTDWTDLSPGDPGVVLLEAFAYLTEQMIYRLNRLPRKVYVAFLRMLGVTIYPPIAASVMLKALNKNPALKSIPLPRGSLVSTAESGQGQAGERLVFTTVQDVEIPASSESEERAISVRALHCEQVEESLGQSKGIPGQFFQVRQPPIVARLPADASWLEITVGVEVANPKGDQKNTRSGSDGKTYHLWNEVENFSESSPTGEDFMVDRQAGLIHFAPAARSSAAQPVQLLAAVPPAGREIRVWYARGGGAAGNVNAGVLNTLFSVPGQARLPEIDVTNPEPARGGFDAETLENALIRGPREINAQRRAVTAREFDNIVLKTKLVSRAHSAPHASLWRHAVPGTVDIVLVPRLIKEQLPSLETLLARQDQTDLGQVEAALKDRSPIGIRSQLRWARYKKVWVDAQITYRGNEEHTAIEQRVAEGLNRLISPLPDEALPEGEGVSSNSAYSAGWPFGQQLRVADIYSQILVGEGSDVLITSLDLHLEHAPGEDVACLAADFHQPHTWYAGSGQRLFRSTNDGSGWELVLHLDPNSRDEVLRRHRQSWTPTRISRDEKVRHVSPSPDRPGFVALSTETTVKGGLQSSLYFSPNCGENWYQLAALQETGTVLQPGEIQAMAWMVRGNRPILLLATDVGLLEVNLDFGPDGSLLDVDFFQVPVLADQPAYPAYALAVVRSRRGSHLVTTALKGRRGVYIASGDSLGSGTSFVPLPISEVDLYLGEDIRHLNVQYLGDRIYLWAAVMALNDNGQGCYRWQFDQSGRVIDAGRWVSQNWFGGSCLAVAFDRNYVYGATAWGGLLRASVDERQPDWLPAWDRFPIPDLPHRTTQIEGTSRKEALIEPLIAIDARLGVVMVASQGQGGIFRRLNPELNFKNEQYENVSRDTLSNLKDAVTLPPDWLLISGTHRITATRDDSSLQPGSTPVEAAKPSETGPTPAPNTGGSQEAS